MEIVTKEKGNKRKMNNVTNKGVRRTTQEEDKVTGGDDPHWEENG